MKPKKQLRIKYSFVDYEQAERQKRLDDAYDVIFDELDAEDLERLDKKDEYGHPATIQR
ncbi:MAG TPA: hypothetical protein VMR81_00655 [Patescibacteria group bacterium]|nr:hypothetical protein [Patescibacteria group bacterium]